MYLIETLEERRLLAWGPYPQLINQDQAVATYPTITGSGVNIALIDSGVDSTQPNLAGKIWTSPGEIAGNGKDDDGDGYVDDIHGWDFYSNDNTPEDQNGHGTATAGIIASSTFSFNAATNQGIAPNAKIIPLKVSDPTGGYNLPFAQHVEQALQWVEKNYVKYNIKIVSMSIRTPASDYNNTYADEISRLLADGLFLVAAGGQEDPNIDVEYPARTPGVFGVSVVEPDDTFPTDSVNRGPGIDLLAPGDGVAILKRGSGYTTSAQATSYATPFAAGAAALLLQVDPTLTATELTNILKSSGSNVTDTSTGFTFSGLTYKRLDLLKAIQTAKAGVSTAPQPPSTNASSSAIAYDSTGALNLAYYDEGSKNLKFAKRSAAGVWSSATTVDSGVMAGQFVSIAIDSANHPGIAYYDANNADLKYAHFNGSSWTVLTADSQFTTGYYPSLQYDSSDQPNISYYYKTGADLKFAILSGGTWILSTIDSAGDVGRYSSLQLNPVTGRWSVAYEDTTKGWFKYANQTKTSWSPVVVDSATKIGGGYISLAFSPTTKEPAMSYYDAYNGDLKYALFNGSTWSKQTVAAKGTVGLYSNLLIDDTGHADILYYSKNADTVARAEASGSSWSFTQVTTLGGRWISRAVDGSGNETISYVKGTAVVVLGL
jgi:ribosomal protein L12E/L44/L45/RPP1/RPP2